MTRRIAALAALALLAASCGSKVEVVQRGDGTCVQVRTERVFGIDTTANENMIECP